MKDLTIGEVIERFKQNAEYERTHGSLEGCLCFRQLVEWLEELRSYRNEFESKDATRSEKKCCNCYNYNSCWSGKMAIIVEAAKGCDEWTPVKLHKNICERCSCSCQHADKSREKCVYM